MDKYLQAINTIIHEQELIVGKTVALWQAKKVPTLQIQEPRQITLNGDPKDALANLVLQYSELFGQASVEVCKDAIKKASIEFTVEELPEILR
jgi:hypothetical protein